MGENECLRKRVNQVFERLETQIKQILRRAEIQEGLTTHQPASTMANLLVACVEGRIIQFVRSGFKQAPTQCWPDQWSFLSSHLLTTSKFGSSNNS